MSEQNIWNGTFLLGNTSACTISAGPGIKIDDSSVPGVIKVSTDETVLWSGTPDTSGYTISLSDNLNNYESFAVEWKSYEREFLSNSVATTTSYPLYLGAVFITVGNACEKTITTWVTNDGLNYTWKGTTHSNFTASPTITWNANVVPLKIIGINRKQNGGN